MGEFFAGQDDTPSSTLIATGLWVNHCSHFKAGTSVQMMSRTIADYVLVYTVSGEGWVRLDRSSYTVGPGDVFLLPPRVDHGFGTGSGGAWEVLGAHLGGPTIAHLLAFWPDYPHASSVHLTHPDEMMHLLTSMLRTMAERRDLYSLLVAGQADRALRLIIREARRSPDDGAPSRARTLVETVDGYIHDHLAEPLTLAQMADYVHVNPAYLCRVFKRVTGFSPLEYSIKQRINRAKALLRSTALPVVAVARHVGYHDAAYFARVFRATTGVSPTAFRRLAFFTIGEPRTGGGDQ